MISEKEVNELRLKALSLCRDYLGGVWRSLKEDDLQFRRISGGLSNYLFKCTVPDYIDCEGQPRSVILRVYGQHLVARTSEILKDTAVSLLLSEWGIGPKVYAVRGSSRLEQYFEALTLKTSDLKNGSIRRKVAQSLAKFHSLEMPLMKEPRWLFDTVQNYLQKIKGLDFGDSNERMLYDRLLEKVDLNKEFVDLRSILNEVPSKVVFCHNDVQPGNILLMDNGEIKLIDYEYSGYNYRGFDIGNFFCESMFDYTRTSYPYFDCCFNSYPSLEEQRTFIEHYVRYASKTSNPDHLKHCNSVPAENGFLPAASSCGGDFKRRASLKDQFCNEVRSLLKEASYFSLASNFMWSIWSIYLSYESRIDFNYMEYGICRLFAYFYAKKQILKGGLTADDQALMARPLTELRHFFDLIDSLPVL